MIKIISIVYFISLLIALFKILYLIIVEDCKNDRSYIMWIFAPVMNTIFCLIMIYFIITSFRPIKEITQMYKDIRDE